MAAGEISFSAQLALWFEHAEAELPVGVRRLVQVRFRPFAWDTLSPRQRRDVARQWDHAHPTGQLEQLEAEEAFSRGFRRVATSRSVQKRNARLAKRPRPRRQKVDDASIARMRATLELEGLPPHKQCSEAYRRLDTQMTLRAFRYRWKKGS